MDCAVLESLRAVGCSVLEVCYQTGARQPKKFDPARVSGISVA